MPADTAAVITGSAHCGGKCDGCAEDITDERRDRADRGLPGDAVSRPVHLREEGNGNRRADHPANRGEERVLETERGKNVAARHHEKAGKPRPCELFSSRAGKAARAQHQRMRGH